MERAFFCNSGAEANEAAIKLARLYAHKQGWSDAVIVVMEGDFHGRTMGALSASVAAEKGQLWGPLLSGFVRIPHASVAALQEVFSASRPVAAVLLEVIQGEGVSMYWQMRYCRLSASYVMSMMRY